MKASDAIPDDCTLYNQCAMARTAIAEAISATAHLKLTAQNLDGPPRERALVILLEVGMMAFHDMQRRRTTGLSGLLWRCRVLLARRIKRMVEAVQRSFTQRPR